MGVVDTITKSTFNFLLFNTAKDLAKKSIDEEVQAATKAKEVEKV